MSVYGNNPVQGNVPTSLFGKALGQSIVPTDGQVITFVAANDRWEPLAAGAGADTKVVVFENLVQVGAVARRLNYSNVDDFAITEDAGNDVFTFAINRNAASGIAGLDSTSRLAKANQHLATVYNDQANIYTAGAKQSVTHDATTAGLRFVGAAGDPSVLVNGDVWHNTTSNLLFARLNAVTREFVFRTLAQILTGKTMDANLNTFTNFGASEVIADIITGQTLLAGAADPAADELLIHDFSLGALRRVTPNNLGLPVSDQDVQVNLASVAVGVPRHLNFANANHFGVIEDAPGNEIDITIDTNVANGICGLDASALVPLAQIANLTNAELATGVFAAITGLGVQTQALDMDGNDIILDAAGNIRIDNSVINVTTLKHSTNFPNFSLLRDQIVPDGSIAGKVRFRSKDSSGAVRTFGEIRTVVEDTTVAGNLVHGSLHIFVRDTNVETDYMNFNAAKSGSIDVLKPMNVSVGVKLSVTHDAINAGLRFVGAVGDPSTLVNGDVWHNTTSNLLFARLNAVTREFLFRTLAQIVTNKTMDANLNTFTNFGASEVIADLITGQTAAVLPVDVAADEVLIHDSSAGALRRAAIEAIQKKLPSVLTAQGAILPAAGGPTRVTVAGANHSFVVLDYPNGSTTSAFWDFRMPSDIGLNLNLTFIITWISTVITGDVDFSIAILGRADSEPYDAALTNVTTVTLVTDPVAGDINRTTITINASGVDEDDDIIVRLQRLGALDTMVADARFINCRMLYA